MCIMNSSRRCIFNVSLHELSFNDEEKLNKVQRNKNNIKECHLYKKVYVRTWSSKANPKNILNIHTLTGITWIEIQKYE